MALAKKSLFIEAGLAQLAFHLSASFAAYALEQRADTTSADQVKDLLYVHQIPLARQFEEKAQPNNL